MSAETTTSRNNQFHLSTEQQELFNRAMMILLGVGIGWLLFADKESYITNIFTEILGVLGTFFVLDYWVRRRDQQNQLAEIKFHLVLEAGSSDNVTALNAIRKIRGKKYHSGQNGILKGADLQYANLKEAGLRFANLENTILAFADLRNAQLIGANIKGSHLQHSSLEGADLRQIQIDGTTHLPDSSSYDPVKGLEQLSRFTNPNHPEFWEPDWIKESKKTREERNS